jgi:two-component system, LytTR family, sensor kinase
MERASAGGPQTVLLPDRREVALILAGWTLYGLFAAAHRYLQSGLTGPQYTWGYSIGTAFVEAYLWALATIAIFYLARRFPLERGRLRVSVPAHLLAASALSFGRLAIMVELSRRIGWLVERGFASQLRELNVYVLFYVLRLGVALAADYYRRYREREIAANRLEAGLAEARLQALKMQIHPHFLFNTLNAISALIPPEAQPARRMVARLGDLLRNSLEHQGHEVTLREELSLLEPFLEIERIRLGERLTLHVEIAGDVQEARVPHLILQPLVENAIRHGVARRPQPGSVHIRAWRDGATQSLNLEVLDDGPGPGSGDPRRTGVGLANVRSRLAELYGDGHDFLIAGRAEGGTRVTITLPFSLLPTSGAAG